MRTLLPSRVLALGLAAALVSASGGLARAGTAALTLTKARLRFNTTTQGDKSAIRAQGFFITDPPTDDFIPTNGFSIRTQDGVTLDKTVTFAAAECAPIPGKTKCKSSDRALQATFRPLPDEPTVIQFSFVLKRQGLSGPFNGPVTVTLTETGSSIERSGTVTDCVLKITGLTCRQF